MSSARPARLEVLGVGIDPLDAPELVDIATHAARSGEHRTLFYANAHTLALAGRDPAFLGALRRADVVFCDGFGARLTAGILGHPLPPRATPPDWIDALAGALAAEGLPVYLLGGAPGVSAGAAAALRSAHPGLVVAGHHPGYFVRDGADNERVLAAIAGSAARALLVGLGQPRQELWVDRHRARLPPLVLGVGALFEWLAGSDRRAPRWASQRGLEWAFRFARHPLRHFRRYAIGLPAVALGALRARLLPPRPAATRTPLRVAYSFAPTDAGHSGGYRHLRDLLEALSRDPNLDLHVFALDRDRPLLPEGSFVVHRVARLWQRPAASILWHRLVLPWRARRIGARVLHLPYANRRLATATKPPVLATVLDLAELELPERYGRLRARHARSLRAALRDVPAIAAISDETRRLLVASGVDPERVTTVPLGHRPLPALTPDQARARLAERHGIERVDLLYVSRLEHPGKNHVRLLDALALLRGAGRALTLVLAGAPWTGVEAIEQRLRVHGLERQVCRLGFVPDEDLAAAYAMARALVFPSLVEGFGLPVLEALAAGLPVACSDRPPMRDLFAGAVLAFDPEDPKSIAQAIARILDDEALRATLRARGLERAGELSWRQAAECTAELYRALAWPGRAAAVALLR